LTWRPMGGGFSAALEPALAERCGAEAVTDDRGDDADDGRPYDDVLLSCWEHVGIDDGGIEQSGHAPHAEEAKKEARSVAHQPWAYGGEERPRADDEQQQQCEQPAGDAGRGQPWTGSFPGARTWDPWGGSAIRQTLTDEPTPEERRNILLTEYQEVCRSHAGITDFRAKLLALLPLASGAGLGLLLAQGNGGLSRTEAGLLVALGAFGAVVTAGLFLYELRQIDVCKQLRNHAEWIERQLAIEAGQFGGRRERLSLREVYSGAAAGRRDEKLKLRERSDERVGAETSRQGRAEKTSAKGGERRKRGWLDRHFIGAEAAGYVVYHAVIVAWLFAAGVGIANLI
jgi:hypothetical protein